MRIKLRGPCGARVLMKGDQDPASPRGSRLCDGKIRDGGCVCQPRDHRLPGKPQPQERGLEQILPRNLEEKLTCGHLTLDSGLWTVRQERSDTSFVSLLRKPQQTNTGHTGTQSPGPMTSRPVERSSEFSG